MVDQNSLESDSADRGNMDGGSGVAFRPFPRLPFCLLRGRERLADDRFGESRASLRIFWLA